MTETGAGAVVTVMLAARELRLVVGEGEQSWESETVLSWLEGEGEGEEEEVPVPLELGILRVEEVPKQEAVEAALLEWEQMMLEEEAEAEEEQRL